MKEKERQRGADIRFPYEYYQWRFELPSEELMKEFVRVSPKELKISNRILTTSNPDPDSWIKTLYEIEKAEK